MVKAIRFHKVGGPEVLSWDDIDLPPLGEEDIRVRHTVIGLNFIDTYHRSGLYPLPLPSGIGMEGAGIVTAVGTRRNISKPWRPCSIRLTATRLLC